MKATTIKVEGNLLKEMEAICPHSQSISGFIREILQKELTRRKLAEAATQYANFVASHPEEQNWLVDWESADLSSTPKTKAKKS